MLFTDPDTSAEQNERILQLFAQAQKDYYTTQVKWEALVRRVIGVLQEWYDAIEEGTANYRLPSAGCPISDEQADALIQVIDQFFVDEYTEYNEYWTKRMLVDAPPEFSRLEITARKALAEDLYSVLAEAEAAKASPQQVR